MSALVGFTGPPDPKLLQRLLRSLSHRGGDQPVTLETSRASLAVVDHGGLPAYGSTATQGRLTNHGAVALSGCWIGGLPDHWNDETLGKQYGSFTVAQIIDDQLQIARDPVGTQSLYLGRWSDPEYQPSPRWIIASEPKAITSLLGFRRVVRPAALAQYLSFSFIPGSETMLEDLWEVPAGTILTLNLQQDQEPAWQRYFCFEDDEYQSTQNADLTFWTDRTRQCIQQSVARRMPRGDVAVALSGGLDSSIVAAEVAQQATGTVHTFSLHFGHRYPNELQYARMVAQKIGSRHHEILIRPRNFLSQFRRMVWHLDEPIGDPITQPNFELASIVARDFPVMFNGEGGDPLFGGPKNLTMLLHHWYGGPNRSVNFREQAYLASYRRAYEEWSRLLHPDIRNQIDPQRDLESLLKPFFETKRPVSFLNKLMAINIRLKGAHLILPKVDRMFAAHGLTPLSPLFDPELTRLSFQMPPQCKLKGGIEKYVLKKAYQDLLPAPVIDRPKSGMRVPVHYWFQAEMKRFARRLLSRRSLQVSGMLDPVRVQSLLRYQTEEGPGRYGLRLWMLLTLELWHQLVVQQKDP